MVTESEYMERLKKIKINPNRFPEVISPPYPEEKWFRNGGYLGYISGDYGIIIRIEDLNLIFCNTKEATFFEEIPDELAERSLKALKISVLPLVGTIVGCLLLLENALKKRR